MQEKMFADIAYDRPDYEKYAQMIQDCAAQIRQSGETEEICQALEKFFDYKTAVGTMETVAFIRCYQDCTDKFYQEEMQYTQSQSAMIDVSPIYDALLESTYREEIDARYGRQFLLTVEKKRSLIRGGLDLMGREQELIAKYQNMLSSMRFLYDGKELSSAELSEYRESMDSSVRKEARNASRKAFADKSEEYLQILEELTKVRKQIAQANGYENYLEYANTQKGRYSYGEKELAQLCQLVRNELVPLKKRLYEHVRERLGIAAYTADDTGIYFKEGNPKPLGDAQFLLDQAEKMYTQIDKDFVSLFNEMKDGGYFDCQKSANKITGMGFCTPIYSEKLPFIFGNCTGSHSDVDVLIHEFGHAIQMQMSMDNYIVPEYWEMPNDLAEIPSKTMEQMSYEYASLFFGERASEFVETHLITILQEICSFCMIHEFETYLYTAESFDSEEAIAVYNKLTKIYNDGVDYRVCQSYMDKGVLLMQDMGIYMFPRYLISYALSDISAISIRLMCETDRERGLAVYKKLCGLGGFLEYSDAMKALDLPLPYMEQVILDTRDHLAEKLGLAS